MKRLLTSAILAAVTSTAHAGICMPAFRCDDPQPCHASESPSGSAGGPLGIGFMPFDWHAAEPLPLYPFPQLPDYPPVEIPDDDTNVVHTPEPSAFAMFAVIALLSAVPFLRRSK